MMNYDHLLDQAEALVRPSTGAHRQMDLRRAVSGAYYGLFHFTLTAAADYLIGRTKRSTRQYVLVYRSVSHRAFREVSVEVKKPASSVRYAVYVPVGGWGSGLQAFAAAAVELQERRHLADYDPSLRLSASDARLAIRAARSAVGRFLGVSADQRSSFLALLAFPPR